MATAKTVFICQECGYKSVRWLGKCPSCNSWNSFVEEVEGPKLAIPGIQGSSPVPMSSVEAQDYARLSTGLKGLDFILGSGLVPASVILLGGDPGIGKSTLSLELAAGIAAQSRTVLYISGEESAAQVKMRAERLGAVRDNIFVVSETNLDSIISSIEKTTPFLVILDSIQTVFWPQINSSPGSVSQVRECASRLAFLAKTKGFCLWMIGHVTKDGAIAGPRTLEHLVDVVLYFEGEGYNAFRILRAVKNRFGATNELAVFEMRNEGLIEVENPSEFFISNYNPGQAGVCITAVMEGVRPILVEVQALVAPSSGFGAPLRRCQGFDPNRLSMLLAVLEKRLGYRLYEYDVFVSVAGGLRVKDPGGDLGVVMAIVSSLRSLPLPEKTVAIGEIGLTGDVRSVSMMQQRIKEAERIGFSNVIAPVNGPFPVESALLFLK